MEINGENNTRDIKINECICYLASPTSSTGSLSDRYKSACKVLFGPGDSTPPAVSTMVNSFLMYDALDAVVLPPVVLLPVLAGSSALETKAFISLWMEVSSSSSLITFYIGDIQSIYIYYVYWAYFTTTYI
jgi:hypothetical protein